MEAGSERERQELSREVSPIASLRHGPSLCGWANIFASLPCGYAENQGFSDFDCYLISSPVQYLAMICCVSIDFLVPI